MNAFLTYRLIACLALFCCLITYGQEEEEATSPATDILATHSHRIRSQKGSRSANSPRRTSDAHRRHALRQIRWLLCRLETHKVPYRTCCPRTTIYTHIAFSEGMDHVAADTKKARPILYYRIAGKRTRYRITAFGAAGEDFLSGDCKPLKTRAAYLAKYVVGAEDTGAFTLAVGKRSADRDGNELTAFYVHKKSLQLGMAAVDDKSVGDPVEATSVPVNIDAPTVTEVGFYKDLQLQQPITEPLESCKS